jgi:hypothetical protein
MLKRHPCDRVKTNNVNKKKKIQRGWKSGVLILVVGLLSGSLKAQSDNFPIGSRPAALGNAYSMQADLWSLHHNQAGLGFYPHFALGFHHENKFVVSEYNLHAIGVTYPVNAGTFGLSYSYFGYSAYNESKIGLAFGRKFGETFAAGIQLNYHHNFLAGEYGDRNAVSIEGGIQYRAGDKVAFGAHLFNPTRSKISPYDQDTIPTVFRTGVSVIPVEDALVLFQIEKRPNQKLRIHSGLELLIMESLYLRGGIMTQPFTATFGLGYEIGKLSADVAFSRHQVLGFTPHFSLQFKFR